MEKIEHSYLNVRGLNLHIAHIGKGELGTVLFLHGFPEIWYSWRHQMIAVAEAGFRAIAPDCRGYGLSQQPPEPEKASWKDLVDDLLAILDSLSIPKVPFCFGFLDQANGIEMRKKGVPQKKEMERSGGRSKKPWLAVAEAGILKNLIHAHALFFDHLVDLIPARFYLPPDDDKPWFQGLSNAAKATAKKESRENLKKARRARFDPEKSTTTLDVLKKSIFEAADKSSDDGSGSDEAPEIDENPGRPVVAEERSVTYEELRQRLHRRIEELRSNRNTRPSNKSNTEKNKENKKDQKGKKNENNKAGEEAEPSPQGKRKREVESEEGKGKKKKKVDKEGDAGSADITFGQVKIGDDDDKKKKKKKLSKKQALERVKKLEETKKDPEKGGEIAKKHSWKAAVRRAAGIKVHDDPKLLKESIKKEKKRQQKHSEKWKERMESVDKLRTEKQKKRTENIKERIHQKKMRRIEKREKKLMRPGFEGRKEGYINK